MDPLIGRTFGPYEIQAPIGGGGMGAVYRAMHRGLGRPRAIKILPPQLALDANFVERFRREAVVVSGLRHPNIVLLHDIGQDGGLHYIVMELVPGRSLRQVLDEEAPLALDRALHILRQLADALDYAHAQAVYHRDVKPANVIVGANDHVTLVDFGIARGAEGSRLTSAGAAVGTPAYMAPEVVRGQSDDASGDLYALGVVAYELLTGRVPFDNPNSTAVMYAQIHTPPPPPLQIRPDLPADLQSPLLRQLAKDPAARFPTARQFVTALEAVAAARVTTRPDDTRPGETIPDWAHGDGARHPLVDRTQPLTGLTSDTTPAQRKPTPPRPPTGVVRPPPPRPRPTPTPTPSPAAGPPVALLAAGVGLAALTLVLVGTLVAWQMGVGPFGGSNPTATPVPKPDPTATLVAKVDPTATPAPPTATSVPPTATSAPPTPTPGPADRLQLARQARAAGDFPRALSLLQALRQTDPTTPGLDEELYQTHLAYGKALLDRGDFDGAFAQYGEALRVRPNDQAAAAGQRQAQLGKLWTQMEAAWNTNEEQAIAALEEIVKLDEGYRDARVKLYDKLIGKADRLINQQGDRVEAFAVLLHALEIDANRSEADARLATYPSSPSPATVFVFDSFDNPNARQLSTVSGAPNAYSIAYEGGEFRIRTVPNAQTYPVIPAPGNYADAAIAADMRLESTVDDNSLLILGCRRQPNSSNEYRLFISPSRRAALITRGAGSGPTDLTDWVPAPLRPGNNRVEFRCIGQTLSIKVNGAVVREVQDSTYREGLFWIGALRFPQAAGGADARFDNLAVLRR